jgi:hypothetical protein
MLGALMLAAAIGSADSAMCRGGPRLAAAQERTESRNFFHRRVLASTLGGNSARQTSEATVEWRIDPQVAGDFAHAEVLMPTETYEVVGGAANWTILHDGQEGADKASYETNEAAFEVAVLAASNALRRGDGVIVKVQPKLAQTKSEDARTA